MIIHHGFGQRPQIFGALAWVTFSAPDIVVTASDHFGGTVILCAAFPAAASVEPSYAASFPQEQR
jgi:hypothetical protein